MIQLYNINTAQLRELGSCTLSAAEILADLSEGGGGVSGHNESAESLQSQLEVSTNSEQQTQEVDVKNTQYEDQTMETIDPDLIVNGVEDIKPMVFHPFSLYMRKQVATTVNINVDTEVSWHR